MTIRLWLQQNGFTVHPINENRDFPMFARYYDDMNLAAIFNHMTGEFYAVRFQSFDAMHAHRTGEWMSAGTGNRQDGMFKPGVANPEKINVLPVVNLHTIETAKHLDAAFAVVNAMVDAELNGVSHHVRFGQRAVVRFPGINDQVGTVVAMDADTITVKMESGIATKFKPENVHRLDLPYFVPGEWIDSVTV